MSAAATRLCQWLLVAGEADGHVGVELAERARALVTAVGADTDLAARTRLLARVEHDLHGVWRTVGRRYRVGFAEADGNRAPCLHMDRPPATGH